MKEQLLKALYTGIGIASYTVDKAKEMGRELADEFNLSKEEGEKLAEEIRNKAKAEKEQFESRVEKEVERVVDKLKLATKSDIDALKKQILDLSQQVRRH